MDNFCNIHVHSYYSLLDSVSSPTNIINREKELGQIGGAITDHGNLFVGYKGATYSKKQGQIYVPGTEFYVVDNMHERTKQQRYHLIVLAKNNEGYKKLCYLNTKAANEGFYYKTRIDCDLLDQVIDSNLIITSACVANQINQNIINNNLFEAEKWVKYYKNLCPNFYLEIQPTILENNIQVKCNMEIIKFARKFDLPLIATTDSHYINNDWAQTQEVALCLQTKKKMNDPTHWKFAGDTYYIASRDDMERMFSEHGHEVLPKDAIKEALDNTVDLVQSTNFSLNTDTVFLPDVPVYNENKQFINWRKLHQKNNNNKKEIKKDYLTYICLKFLKEKKLTSKKYLDRLKYEINTIYTMGWVDYFLIYYDIMNFCNGKTPDKNGKYYHIPVGAGRGCFLPNSKVKLFNNVIKKIQDIQIGDNVMCIDNKQHEILYRYEYDCDEIIINITTDDNKELHSTIDHKIYAIKKDDYINGVRQPKLYEANELNEGDYVAEM